jgi:hypothetical protein
MEDSSASSEAIEPNLGETMGMHGRADNLIQTMHRIKARTSKEVAKRKQKI